MVLKALKTKKLGSGRSNLGAVYLELLARHVDEGVVQMSAPEEHAYAAGFWSTRALRDWRAHMRTLEELGFIKSQAKGHLTFGYVFIIHPTKVLKDLHTRGKLPHGWWENYRSRQIEMKEPTYEDLFA